MSQTDLSLKKTIIKVGGYTESMLVLFLPCAVDKGLSSKNYDRWEGLMGPSYFLMGYSNKNWGGQKIKLIEKGGYCSFNWGCYIIKLDRGGVIQLGGGVKKKLHPPPPTPRFLKEYPLILCSILRFKKLKLAWSFLETPKMFHLQVFLFFEINMYQLS